MNSATFRRLLPYLCFCASLLLSGCAPQKSVIVLLPEDGQVSGQVTVTNARGSQLLNQSWQSVEIGKSQGPATPEMLDQSTVQGAFGAVLAALPLPPVQYLLYFKLDSAELLPDSQLLLSEIAKAIKERQPAQLSVVGHTDTTGSAEHNYQLGLLRARAVPELLSAQDAVAANVEILSRGKAEPRVKTPDQTPEPGNRRAEVDVR